MFKIRLASLAALVLAVGSSAGFAVPPQPTLKVSDPAPGLYMSQWIKGEPVTKFEPGKVYVVEFWATWCGPCKKSIPHLTELQAKYKEITFIGQDVFERKPGKAAPFVKKMGDQMNYHIAIDDVVEGRGRMADAWLTAAGLNSIPTAFLVDKAGKIAWIGNPTKLDPILAAVSAGTFDPQKELAAQVAQKARYQKIDQAAHDGRFDEALALLNEECKTDADLAEHSVFFKYNLLRRKPDAAAASALATELLEKFKGDADSLATLSRVIVNRPTAQVTQDVDLAEKAASRANELTKGEQPEILDALAHVYAAQEHIGQAIETETAAIDKADDDDLKAALTKNLQAMQKAHGIISN